MTKKPAPLRLAIIGRPNVGKSTLFNRLAGRKLAIVHDRPGVTRDRKEATASLGELELLLVDTAGYELAEDESLEARMRLQTELAVAEAEVCLFVIDGRAGLTPIDREFAARVRMSGAHVVLAVNKTEGRAGDGGIMDAYELGLGEPIPISAEHGEGMSDLYSALVQARDTVRAEAIAEAKALRRDAIEGDLSDDESSAVGEDTGDDDEGAPIRLAVVGRPNVGKSTLINALIDEDRLLTGPEAGITRDAVAVEWEWEGRRVRLHDTAGLRRRAKVTDSLERMSTSETIRAANFAEVVLLVMDANEAFEKQDLQIADLVLREGRGLVLIINKWDAVEDKQALRAHLVERAGRLLAQAPGAPLVFISALSERGLEKIMPAVMAVREAWSAKIQTRDLNDWLQDAITRHPPPAVQGRRIRPKYIAQTKARPPTFVLMCSRASAMPDSYVRYLINGIRDEFDMPATPIRMSVKASKNPYSGSAKKKR